MPSTKVFNELCVKITLLRSIPKKIKTVCNVIYFRLCIDLMHILVPVTAEGYDVPQSPEVCRMPLCYPLRCSLFAHIIFFPSYPLSSFCFLLTLFSYPLSCLSFFPSSSLPILLSSPLLPTSLTTLSTFILFRPMFFFLYLYIFPFSSLTISHSKLPFSSVWIFFFSHPQTYASFFLFTSSSVLTFFPPRSFLFSLSSIFLSFFSLFSHQPRFF